ncbi:MAG: homoserine kinase, partial [Acidimicrobiales bacterium]
RTPLFPESAALLTALREAGALTSCWSGAGPSLLAICDVGAAEPVSRAAESLMESHGVAGHVRVLDADLGGVTMFPATGN